VKSFKLEEGDTFKDNKASTYIVVVGVQHESPLDYILSLVYINSSGKVLHMGFFNKVPKSTVAGWTKVEKIPFNF
jgi:hypothetical protein